MKDFLAPPIIKDYIIQITSCNGRLHALTKRGDILYLDEHDEWCVMDPIERCKKDGIIMPENYTCGDCKEDCKESAFND